MRITAEDKEKLKWLTNTVSEGRDKPVSVHEMIDALTYNTVIEEINIKISFLREAK